MLERRAAVRGTLDFAHGAGDADLARNILLGKMIDGNRPVSCGFQRFGELWRRRHGGIIQAVGRYDTVLPHLLLVIFFDGHGERVWHVALPKGIES
jgi:hypothetical protein